MPGVVGFDPDHTGCEQYFGIFQSGWVLKVFIVFFVHLVGFCIILQVYESVCDCVPCLWYPHKRRKPKQYYYFSLCKKFIVFYFITVILLFE